jgi:hypothetical protein
MLYYFQLLAILNECLLKLQHICAAIDDEKDNEALLNQWNRVCFRLDAFFLLVTQIFNFLILVLYFTY